jgi:hypothetical protein
MLKEYIPKNEFVSNIYIWFFKLYTYFMYLVNPLLILQPILSETNLHKTMKIQYVSTWIYTQLQLFMNSRRR